MSLIRMLKRSDPSTEPCGIPQETGGKMILIFLFAHIDFFHIGNFSTTIIVYYNDGRNYTVLFRKRR